MAEAFLLLPDEDRRQILQAVASRLGRRAIVLEKDVWVCWSLQQVFGMKGAVKMAFKGGTSLSKVYSAIYRFSEDVDVTLDYRAWGPALDPFADGQSKTKQKRIGEELKNQVRTHVHGIIVPALRQQLAEVAPDERYRVDASEDGEKVWIRYPSIVDGEASYISDSVLLEFGGRNVTEPDELHPVRPYLAAELPDLAFPEAEANVLSGTRTFWEKATLMHVECNRPEFRTDANRLSRHWYDLSKLADHAIGQKALADRALLASVVKHKKVFFHAAFADYDACLDRRFKLVPNDHGRAALEKDYAQMRGAGMFFEEPPAFGDIVERLAELEAVINTIEGTCEAPLKPEAPASPAV